MTEHGADTLRHLGRLYGEDRRTWAFSGRSRADFETRVEPARGELRRLIGLERMSRDLADFEPVVALGESETLDGYTRWEG